MSKSVGMCVRNSSKRLNPLHDAVFISELNRTSETFGVFSSCRCREGWAVYRNGERVSEVMKNERDAEHACTQAAWGRVARDRDCRRHRRTSAIFSVQGGRGGWVVYRNGERVSEVMEEQRDAERACTEAAWGRTVLDGDHEQSSGYGLDSDHIRKELNLAS